MREETLPLPPECYESSRKCEEAIENKLNEIASLYLPGLEELARSYGLKLKDLEIMLSEDFDIELYPSYEDDGPSVLEIKGTILASALFEPVKECPERLASVYNSLINAVGKMLEDVIDEVLGDVYEKAEVDLDVSWDNLDLIIKGCPNPFSTTVTIKTTLNKP